MAMKIIEYNRRKDAYQQTEVQILIIWFVLILSNVYDVFIENRKRFSKIPKRRRTKVGERNTFKVFIIKTILTIWDKNWNIAIYQIFLLTLERTEGKEM